MQEMYGNGQEMYESVGSLNLKGLGEAINSILQNEGILHQNAINPIIVDNKYGLIIKLSRNYPFNVESHEAFVMIFRDKEGNIVSVDIDYKGVDDDSSDK
ncbi:hypothetical protein L3N51_02312 [Metallosphaera sp. J1]|uniref:hypothetical protein n=1 Tax=Metallosphaera javensis (ex Hofmann et al. 2022) TaxID=99938 RepID=UPI001EDEC3FB|nr:hypothetical protein [Metallosphaera javensis (ex Hofmann et al. 2022)]MCG3110015.1 hypothetical protein [Metallosphaera javensis (ex Hofmann et al. 2022)]